MIKSQLSAIDEFLNGGFRGGFITDVFGAAGTGKTQLALQICANALADGKIVLFHDTKGEFRPERILELLQARKQGKELLDNIHVRRITNTKEQISSLDRIEHDFALLVVDDLSELFSFEYGKDRALEKNQLFMKYMRNLSKIAIAKNIPIITVNTVRIIDDTETENLERAASIFTHIKIYLQKYKLHTRGTITSVHKKSKFEFEISRDGLDIPSESF